METSSLSTVLTEEAGFIPTIKTVMMQANVTVESTHQLRLSLCFVAMPNKYVKAPIAKMFLINACNGVIGKSVPKHPQFPLFPVVSISYDNCIEKINNNKVVAGTMRRL